jgi:hypothetical protein
MFLNYEDNKSVLEMLNRHFKATTFEKYPEAMMSIIMQQAGEKILGKNYQKDRISKRKSEQLYKHMLNRLQGSYGKYINITHFKAKDPWSVKFSTNFNRVFKTDFGVLYGSLSVGLWKTVFYISHCFERFAERRDAFLCNPLIKILTEYLKTKPTDADIIMALVSLGNGGFEYGRKENFYYLNINVGIVVLEDFEEFFVAKTFLDTDMVDPNWVWYKPLLTPAQFDYPSRYFKSLKEVLDHDPIKITGPSFINDLMKSLVKEYIQNNPEPK